VTVLLIAAMTVLLLALVAGLVRIVRGPEDADRMLAAQLLGTGAVAILILMSQAMAAPRLLDVALVFAILALVAVACFAATDGQTDDDDPC
jgi:multicomponent Na+:H+ antiporter subunit F